MSSCFNLIEKVTWKLLLEFEKRRLNLELPLLEIGIIKTWALALENIIFNEPYLHNETFLRALVGLIQKSSSSSTNFILKS